MTDNLPPIADESIAGALIACSIVFLLVNSAVVCLRFYVRLRVIRKFGTDDWALAGTLVSTAAAVIGTAFGTKLGLGAHIDSLSLEERSLLLKLIFVSALGYHLCIMLLKSTFLLQYRRAFPLPAFQQLCDIFLAFLAVWAVAGVVGGITICLPLSKNWDPREPTWMCEPRFWFWVGHGIVHVVTDVLIFVMPLPLLRTLPLPLLHKVALIGVFSLGFVTCLISALRLTTLRASLLDPDVSWTSAKTVFWSIGEVTCSVVCLCIPTLRPLLGSCFSPRLLDDNIMERGTQRFAFDVISLPSTVGTGPPPSPVPTRLAAAAPRGEERI